MPNVLEPSAASNLYYDKLTRAKHSEKDMTILAQKIKELRELNDMNAQKN